MQFKVQKASRIRAELVIFRAFSRGLPHCSLMVFFFFSFSLFFFFFTKQKVYTDVLAHAEMHL